MSGGHWDYGRSIDADGEALRRASEANRLLSAIEHELDWGLSCDTCLECAKLRVAEAMVKFFDDGREATAAIAIARDRDQNCCPKCAERNRLRCGSCGARVGGLHLPTCHFQGIVFANQVSGFRDGGKLPEVLL